MNRDDNGCFQGDLNFGMIRKFNRARCRHTSSKLGQAYLTIS
jgi:hypothetical protein